MLWIRVDNASRVQPAKGRYSDWKSQIATDCHRRCVYCAIEDWQYGGLDNFHIDHYRPKSKFARLEETITNLYLSCAICNRFKSNDWPAEPDDEHRVPAYPDPGNHDYVELFEVDLGSGVVAGNFPASRYVVERLFLNRAQLVRLRRIWVLQQRLSTIEIILASRLEELTSAAETSKEAQQLVADICKRLLTVNRAYRSRETTTPYDLGEIKREKRKKRKSIKKK